MSKLLLIGGIRAYRRANVKTGIDDEAENGAKE